MKYLVWNHFVDLCFYLFTSRYLINLIRLTPSFFCLQGIIVKTQLLWFSSTRGGAHWILPPPTYLNAFSAHEIKSKHRRCQQCSVRSELVLLEHHACGQVNVVSYATTCLCLSRYWQFRRAHLNAWEAGGLDVPHLRWNCITAADIFKNNHWHG
jgi:hypothetical protein